MTHKADEEFFREKREWSKRKDFILRYYLPAYLPKLATQRRPICVVDAFAGPGQFEDGEPGSPLIICTALENAVRAGLKVPVKAVLIERKADLCSRLSLRIGGFSFASVHEGTFLQHLPEVVRVSRTHSTFLYLDPFTVDGLEWEGMDQVFSHLERGVSIEVLLNFNANSFARRGCAALKMAEPPPDDQYQDIDEAKTASGPPATIDELNRVVGGDWWQQILRSPDSYEQQVAAIIERYCSALRARFQEVCCYEVKAHSRHRVPKYVLVFGSRHPDALRLMNDAMCKARDRQAVAEAPRDDTLFEMRPKSLVPDLDRLPGVIKEALTSSMTRGELIETVIRRCFCTYSTGEVAKAVGALIKSGEIMSATGKPRINDDVVIRRSEPASG